MVYAIQWDWQETCYHIIKCSTLRFINKSRHWRPDTYHNSFFTKIIICRPLMIFYDGCYDDNNCPGLLKLT